MSYFYLSFMIELRMSSEPLHIHFKSYFSRRKRPKRMSQKLPASSPLFRYTDSYEFMSRIHTSMVARGNSFRSLAAAASPLVGERTAMISRESL